MVFGLITIAKVLLDTLKSCGTDRFADINVGKDQCKVLYDSSINLRLYHCETTEYSMTTFRESNMGQCRTRGHV